MSALEDALTKVEVVSGHLRDATDRVAELLASLQVDTHVSREIMLDAVENHAHAILGHIFMARWELPFADPDEPLDRTDPQAMNISESKEPGNEG